MAVSADSCGFSSDAQWSIDGAGNRLGQCCLSVTLQDFAHLGQIHLEKY